LLPPAVSSNGAAFLQLSTTSSGEGRWLNLQIQHSRGIFYANIATTADTGVGPTSNKQALTTHQLNAAMRGIYPLSCSPKFSVFPATPYIGHWGMRRCSQVRFAKGLALAPLLN